MEQGGLAGRAPAGRVFVGRAAELAQLLGDLHDARAGLSRLAMLVGEPGIGKTRLADEVCAAARDGGACVLWGRCREGGGTPAFWPWTQVLRGLVGTTGADASGVAQLVPELAGDGASSAIEPEHARFRLFDAVGRVLARAAARQPLVLVFDDAHEADEPSLVLLRFVARELREASILLVVTHREECSSGPVAEHLAGLARDGRPLALAGLTRAEVARLMEAVEGVTPPDGLVTAVREATEGNPYFVREVLALRAQGRTPRDGEDPGPATPSVPVPQRLRDTIHARLRPLSAQLTRVLGYASVLGREFDLAPLRYLAHRPDDELVRVLDEAVAAGIVATEPDGRSVFDRGTAPATPQYRFTHALLRQTLYEDLPRATRPALHRRVAEVLEGLHAAHLEPHLAELAHHFLKAAPVGAVDKAIDYAVRASRQAIAQLAYEDAAGYYERALRLVGAGARDIARCDLLLALGDAQWRCGRADAARQAFHEAATIARAAGSARRLARAALGLGGGRIEPGVVDHELIALLEEALRAGESEDASGLRVRLLARLAVALYFTPLVQRRAEIAGEAVARARELNRPSALGAALAARHFALWGPDTLTERLADANELLQVARDAGDRPLLLEGRTWRIVDLLELGEVRVASAEIDSYTEAARELRLPLYRWYARQFQAMRALVQGRFDEGERYAKHALATGRQAGIGSAAQFFAAQMFVVRREQGRLGELEVPMLALIDQFPALSPWRPALVILHVELGREEQARREFDALAAEGFDRIPRDGNWLITTALLAEACALLGDVGRSRELTRLLRPVASRTVVVASAVACFGPVSHYLGMLAAAASRVDEAAALFEDALGASERAGARPWYARTQHEYGALLRGSGRPTDARRAAQLLRAARATYAELGMVGPARRLDVLEHGRSHAS